MMNDETLLEEVGDNLLEENGNSAEAGSAAKQNQLLEQLQKELEAAKKQREEMEKKTKELKAKQKAGDETRSQVEVEAKRKVEAEKIHTIRYKDTDGDVGDYTGRLKDGKPTGKDPLNMIMGLSMKAIGRMEKEMVRAFIIMPMGYRKNSVGIMGKRYKYCRITNNYNYSNTYETISNNKILERLSV